VPLHRTSRKISEILQKLNEQFSNGQHRFSYVSEDGGRSGHRISQGDRRRRNLRFIPQKIPTLDDLQMPAPAKLCDHHQGMILVTAQQEPASPRRWQP
jgi:Tfp pilus assembly pilus retraction ATPase PilT